MGGGGFWADQHKREAYAAPTEPAVRGRKWVGIDSAGGDLAREGVGLTVRANCLCWAEKTQERKEGQREREREKSVLCPPLKGT